MVVVVVVDPIGQPCFQFIRMSVVVDLAIGLGRAEGLAIGRAISTGADVAVNFSRLSL